jgi:hypothetical protein
MELELIVLLALCIVGPATFAVFEVETPAWRKIMKWGIVCGLTVVLAQRVGHWALLVPAGLAVAALTFHLIWCRRHGIHPLRATPRRRYYALRGWPWVE